MANFISWLFRLIFAVAFCGGAGLFLTWLIKTKNGKMALIAIFWFVAFVAASGILG